MQALDWTLMLLPVLLVLVAGIYAQRYTKSVADFMSGGRVAGRYLLAVSKGEMASGAAVFAAQFEVISHAGFTLSWWHWLQLPIALILTISGFVIYRYRETRAMTLAQFFELRYSKSFRIFTGALAFVAGILNFGIIPVVGARFLGYFLGLPATVNIFSFSLPTHILLMALLLSLAVVIATSGGLITIMIADCLEGIMSQIFFLILIVALIVLFKWSEIANVLGDQPPGKSLLNPFDSHEVKDFNLWFVLMQIMVGAYGTMAWQNAGAQNSAAFSPHESRMAAILGKWRELGKSAVMVLLAVSAMAFLRHENFAEASAQARAEIHEMNDANIQSQMEVPVALSHLLPTGIKGVLCAVLLMGILGGDPMHLHSWGGIFVQDILVPLRKKPFEPKQHIRILRLAMIGVAIFAFFFGCLFRQTEYIMMWWAVTTAIYVGGAGAAIIGGLYWKKGTTAGAWAALIAGSSLSVGGICLKQFMGSNFPLNGMQIAFTAMTVAVIIYVAVSLLTFREDFNMDRLLHRGAYRVSAPEIRKQPSKWSHLIGVDENFSRSDKWIAGALFGWSMLLLSVFISGTIWNLVRPWPLTVWSIFWHTVGVGFPVGFAFITGIWFSWGGFRDMRDLFRKLSREKINHLDDGTVVGHQNLDEKGSAKDHGGPH